MSVTALLTERKVLLLPTGEGLASILLIILGAFASILVLAVLGHHAILRRLHSPELIARGDVTVWGLIALAAGVLAVASLLEVM